jgi:DNA repair exonuclease SbcCD ATPase subunit
MGLLARLFGRRESITLELNKVREFIESERAKSTALSREVPEIFAEIKHCIREIRTLMNELEKEELAIENERFRKAALTSKEGFVKRVSLLLQKLEPPFDANAQGVANYCYESKVLLQKEVFASRKNIAYASTALPETMRTIGKLLQSIDDSLEKLNRVINAQPIVFSSMIEKLLEELEEKKRYVEEIQKNIEASESERKVLEKKHSEEKAKLAMLQGSPEAKKLAELESLEIELAEKREKLREQALANFATLRRPLKKLKNAYERMLYSMNAELYQSLEKLISEPELLLKADPKGVSIKAVLNELKKAINKGTITLKEREKKQSIATIEKLLSMDFFSELFWPLNEIEAEINKIQKEIKALDISERIRKLKLEVTRLERELREKEQGIERYTKELETAKHELEVATKSLVQLLSKALNKDVKIVTETERKGMVQA